MNSWPKLQRSPIVEALIDLRVEPRQELYVDELAGLHELLGKGTFPYASQQMTSMMQLAEPHHRVTSSSQLSGWMFRSADQAQVVQAQCDGFAYSRLAPYTGWAELLESARTRWEQYVQVARPRRIKRLAVRYINRIQLQNPVEDFSVWIESFPKIPASLPQGFAEVMQRLVIPVPGDKPVTAIVTLGIQPGRPDDNVVTAIFDIDIFRTAIWPINGQEIWRELDSLRPLKNQFFFAYLTPRALELFR